MGTLLKTWRPSLLGHKICPGQWSRTFLSPPLRSQDQETVQSLHMCHSQLSSNCPQATSPCSFSSINTFIQQHSAAHPSLIPTTVFGLWVFVHISHHVNHDFPHSAQASFTQTERANSSATSSTQPSWIPKKWHLPALSPCQLCHSITTHWLEGDCTWLLSSAKWQGTWGLGSCLGQFCSPHKT